MAYTEIAPSGFYICRYSTAYVGTQPEWLYCYNHNITLLNSTILKLSSMRDVDTTGRIEGQVLRYNAAATKWLPYTPAVTPSDPYDKYVDSVNGLDTWPGTRNQPYKTIQMAATTMGANKKCYVKAGTYAESVSLVFSNQSFYAESGAIITGGSGKLYGFYANNSADNTLIDGFEITGVRYGVASKSNDGWTVQNCRIHDLTYTASDTFTANHGAGVYIESGTSCVVQDNVIYSVYAERDYYGVFLTACTSCTVDGNEIYLIGRAGVTDTNGISGNVIKNNMMWACEGGVDVNASNQSTVQNNLAYYTRYGYRVRHQLLAGSSATTVVTRNTTDCAQRASMIVGVDQPNTTLNSITYNLFKRGGYTAIWYGYATAPITIDHNMYWGVTWNTVLYPTYYWVDDTTLIPTQLNTLAQVKAFNY